MGCDNSPFHSSSLPDARAPTNLHVAKTIRAAGWPKCLHVQQEAHTHTPPHTTTTTFSSLSNNLRLSPTHPPTLILSTCVPHLHLIYCVHLNYTQFTQTRITRSPRTAFRWGEEPFSPVSPLCTLPSICLSTSINTFTIPSPKVQRTVSTNFHTYFMGRWRIWQS